MLEMQEFHLNLQDQMFPVTLQPCHKTNRGIWIRLKKVYAAMVVLHALFLACLFSPLTMALKILAGLFILAILLLKTWWKIRVIFYMDLENRHDFDIVDLGTRAIFLIVLSLFVGYCLLVGRLYIISYEALQATSIVDSYFLSLDMSGSSETTGKSPIVVSSETSSFSEESPPSFRRESSSGDGEFVGVAPRSSGGPEVAPDEHTGLDAVVVETRSTLTSTSDLRNIWELFFAPFEREVSDALRTRRSENPPSKFSFDFDIVPAKPNECVLDGPPDSFAFYLHPMMEGEYCLHLLNLKSKF
ncbi:uncharacterized protein G2W53_030831 [Senna tora]|uniref:Uncharacterized protein n=1 Tax=Senna tora TaxID=362788 RepID=A0A834WBY4_9FABA|nr:uncharacterized protein G2W53_030831 [Senna tora]